MTPQGVLARMSGEEFGKNSIQILCQAEALAAAWLQHFLSELVVQSDYCRKLTRQQEAGYCRLLRLPRVVYQAFIHREQAVIHTQTCNDNIEIDNSKVLMLISACLQIPWGKLMHNKVFAIFLKQYCQARLVCKCRQTSIVQ